MCAPAELAKSRRTAVKPIEVQDDIDRVQCAGGGKGAKEDHLLAAFMLDDVMLQLTTVPTGAVGPPLFAEVLTRAVCAKAVRMAHAQDCVLFDTMIDNGRFVSNDEGS
jgi:hypothetical protein